MSALKLNLIGFLFVHLAILFVGDVAFANSDDGDSDSPRAWQLSWDNDRFIRRGTDQLYTNGIRVDWTYLKRPSNPVGPVILDGLEVLNGEGPQNTASYSFGQLLYTPTSIKTAVPQPTDRPWAAFLYFGIAAHNDPLDSRWHRSSELKIGVVGPSALGEEVQSAVHNVTGSAQPKGWDNQVKSRVGVQLTHARTYRVDREFTGDHIALQFGFGATAGTIRNYLNATATVVVGDLEGQTAPVLVGNEGDFVVADLRRRPQYMKPFGFFSITPTLMLYNYFLEGQTPYGKNDIDIKNLYFTLQYGVSIPVERWLGGKGDGRLLYKQSIRTREFGLDSGFNGVEIGSHRWGTVEFHRPF